MSVLVRSAALAVACLLAAAGTPALGASSAPPAGPDHRDGRVRALAAQIDSVGFDSRTGMGVGGFVSVDVHPVLLMRDGSALTDVSILATAGDLQQSRAAHPRKWTHWRRTAGKVELLGKNGWRALAFPRTHAALPAGFRLDGVFRRLSGTGNRTQGGDRSVSAVSTFEFTHDGSVRHSVVVGSTAAAGSTSVAAAGATPLRTGRYRVDGLMLMIDWRDGSQEQHVLVTDPADPQSAIWIDGAGYVRRKR